MPMLQFALAKPAMSSISRQNAIQCRWQTEAFLKFAIEKWAFPRRRQTSACSSGFSLPSSTASKCGMAFLLFPDEMQLSAASSDALTAEERRSWSF